MINSVAEGLPQTGSGDKKHQISGQGLDQSRRGGSHREQFFIETADLVFPVDEVDL
jgi:hypothetical protein